MVVSESFGVCSKCGVTEILGDSLCVVCWDAREGRADPRRDAAEELLIHQLLDTSPQRLTNVEEMSTRGRRRRWDPALYPSAFGFNTKGQELRQGLEEMLYRLSDRERYVIVSRYGLGVRIQTLATLGGEFGVTRERVRQVEAKALRRLRWQVQFGPFRKLREPLSNRDPTTRAELLLRAVLEVRFGGRRRER